jgi:hypothetical protein
MTSLIKFEHKGKWYVLYPSKWHWRIHPPGWSIFVTVARRKRSHD